MARPKGAKNKHSFQAEELANQLGVDPLEILLLFAKGDWKSLGYDTEVMVCEAKGGESTFLRYTITPEMRVQAARDCAKYLYSTRQAVTLSNPDGSGFKLIIEDSTVEKK